MFRSYGVERCSGAGQGEESVKVDGAEVAGQETDCHEHGADEDGLEHFAVTKAHGVS